MRAIKLDQIIKERGLSTKDVAILLFPHVGHPMNALYRILNGDAVLDANQISRLAAYLNVEISELFDGGGWEGTQDKHVLTLVASDYRATYDRQTGSVSLYHNSSLFHTEVLVTAAITFIEFIEYLDTLIINHKNK